MVLDECLAAGPLESVGARYDAAWKPEADAVSWIGAQIRYQHPVMNLRMVVTRAFGVNVMSQSKSSTRSYSDVRQAARRLGPIWA
jgi:kynurenine 3-monooxygenase